MTVHVLSPGDPRQRTGGYLYNARVVEAWRARGRDVVVHEVAGAWPAGPATSGLPTVAAGDVVLADGLLWTGLCGERARLSEVRVTVVVHLALAGDLRAAEQEALAHVHRVVATGEPTVASLERADVVLIPPGVAPCAATTGPRHALLTVGTLTPRKGLLDLVELLDGLQGEWTWTVAGSPHWDPVYAEQVRAAVASRPWASRVTFTGELDEHALDAVYRRHGTLLHGAHSEPYGMVLQEAAARGLAVVSRPAGALVDVPGASTFTTVAEGRRELAAAVAREEPVVAPSFASWDTVAERLWRVLHG